VISLMGMPFVVLMPIFAARVLHGGPHTLGFLMGAMASVRSSPRCRWRRARACEACAHDSIAAAVFGLGLIGFGLSRVFWLSMIMVAIAAWA